MRRPYDRPPLSKGVLRGEIAEEEIGRGPPSITPSKRSSFGWGRPPRACDRPSGLSAWLMAKKCLMTSSSSPPALRCDRSPSRRRFNRQSLPANPRRRPRDSCRRERCKPRGGGRGGLHRRRGGSVTPKQRPRGDPAGSPAGSPPAGAGRAGRRDLRRDSPRTRGGCPANEGVSAFRGTDRVAEVVTSSGAVIPTDLVVVGVGVRPNVDWLADSGLAIENGILVDQLSRTNLPGVFAAGDVANWSAPGHRRAVAGRALRQRSEPGCRGREEHASARASRTPRSPTSGPTSTI